MRCFFLKKKKGMGNEKYILLLNNVISILDLFKTLTNYIDDKKILEIRDKKKQRQYFFKVLQLF